MVKYKNGRIYKLVNNIDDKIYVGSTTQSLCRRKVEHKSRSKNKIKSNYKVYKHLNKIGWENVDIVLIEKYPCNDKEVMHKRERYWIELLGASLNTSIPTRKIKEWVEKNKDKLKNYKKEYRKQNKEKIRKQQKEYQKKNKQQISSNRKIKITCKCGSIFSVYNKCRHLRSKKHKKFIENKL